MTKEEIKDQATREVFHPEFNYRSLSNGVKVGNLKQRHLEEVLDKAMDAYTRQEAAAFAEFINKKKYYQSYITGFWYPINMEEEAPQLSTNQLYDLYLTHKNKNNG